MPDMVTVRLFAAARAAADGTTEFEAAAGSLAEVLQEAQSRFPGLARVLPSCSFLIDGLQAGAAGNVASGSTLDVLPPFAGG